MSLDKKIKVKDSWSDLSTKTYYELKDILNTPHYTKSIQYIKCLSVLVGVPESHFNNYTLNELETLFMGSSFMMDIPQPKSKEYYTINGKRYKVIHDMRELKAKQFLDLNHFMKDSETIEQNIPTILAILLRKTKRLPWKKRLFNWYYGLLTKSAKGKNYINSHDLKLYEPEVMDYDSSTLLETADEIFEHMKAEEALGLYGFFLNSSDTYCALIQHYLELDLMENLKQSNEVVQEEALTNLEMRKIARKMNQMEIFTKSGTGSQQSTK